MADNNELETLTDLLHGAGWEWFGSHVAKEWGPSGLRYQQAVRDAAQSKEAVVELQKVLYAQEQILALLTAPRARVESLKDARKRELVGPSLSRRGPGL